MGQRSVLKYLTAFQVLAQLASGLCGSNEQTRDYPFSYLTPVLEGLVENIPWLLSHTRTPAVRDPFPTSSTVQSMLAQLPVVVPALHEARP